mgnify:FL=1
MNMNEFDILSMQFRCRYPLGADLLQEHLIQTAAQSNVYNTSTVLIDETSNLEDTVYTMYRNYQKVIEEVRGQPGTVHLYITHHTQKARELVIPDNLLQFFAEKEIYLGVD